LLVWLWAVPAAGAPIILGGSDLLTPAHAAQLESWLGAPIGTLTNIFDHVNGDGKTGAQFHAAADGQGRTFTVVRARDNAAPNIPASYQIFGGYNPLSWNSSGSFNFSVTDAERTAFLFNLSTTTTLAQRLDASGYGFAQTFNSATGGPQFGGGPDLLVGSNLNTGTIFQHSYGVGPGAGGAGVAGINILGSTDIHGLTISDFEVFTIQDAAPVPEPASLLLLSTGLALVAAYARRSIAS
jgi:hypothetical protein